MMVSKNQQVDVEVLGIPRTEWASLGACSIEPGPFMEDGKYHFDKAKQVCSHCSVRTLCLAYAIANNERFGVWGGMTPSERKAHKSYMDVSRVPLEFRDHYLKMEGRVKRSHPTPRYVRNPALDIVIDPEFLVLLDTF